MEVRRANPEDLAAVKRIADILYIEMPDFVWNDEGFIKKQIERGEYWVAEVDGKVVGIVSLLDRNGVLYIETLAVTKDIQAKGIGSSLVDFAKEFARKKGFVALRTTSFYEYGVKDFWLKQGFKLLKRSSGYEGRQFHHLEFRLYSYPQFYLFYYFQRIKIKVRVVFSKLKNFMYDGKK